jgi:hypothetical protein
VGELADDEAADRRLADRCGPAVRDYVARVCGARTPDAVSEAALRRIAGTGVYRPAPRPPAERVCEAAREAALAEAGRLGRRPGMRLRHIVGGRPGHAKVPELLRRRAAGLLSGPEAGRLESTLERCPDCGRLAARLDEAEARLTLALAWISRSVGAAPGLEPGAEPAAERRAEPATEHWAEPATGHWAEPAAERWAEPATEPWADRGPAPGVERRGDQAVGVGRGGQGRRRRRLVVGLTVVLVGAGSAAIAREASEGRGGRQAGGGAGLAGLLAPDLPEADPGQRPAAGVLPGKTGDLLAPVIGPAADGRVGRRPPPAWILG